MIYLLSVTWIRFIYLLSLCYFHSKLITTLIALFVVICFNTIILNHIYLSFNYISLIECFYIFDQIAFFLQAKFRYLTILLLICLLTIDHSESWRRRRFRRFTRRVGRAIRRVRRTIQTVNTAVGVIRAVGAIAGAGKRSADDVCF